MNNFLKQLRDNPRLRWGIILIVGIFWLYLIVLLQESLEEQVRQHHTAAQSAARMRAQLVQSEWADRVAIAKTLALQLEQRLWQAPTSGLAQAAFQDWLNTTSTQAGIVSPQITVSVIDDAVAKTPNENDGTDNITPTDLWKVTAKLSADFSTATFLSLMNLLENHEKQIIVNSLNLRKEPTPRIEIELLGYFIKQDSPTLTNNKPNKSFVPQ